MPPVNDTGVLAGLTDIPWAELRHAYGSADDIPGILRAIADGDDETAKEAASELFGNIWHQGTVYQATAPAVPFLARLASAGRRTATLTGLLGCIAESTDEYGIEPGGARAAVTAQGDLLLPLLADPDPEVRAMAAWALAQCPGMPGLVQALCDRWGCETTPDVRGKLLKAVSVIAPAQAVPMAARVIASGFPGQDAAERLIAAWCLFASGAPWTGSLHEAATAWLADGLDPAKSNWNHEEPFPGLLLDLAARGDLAVAAELAVTAFDAAQRPAARKAAVWAAEKLALDQAAQPPADGATVLHLEARLTLARALWRVTGDAAPLVRSITQVLQPPAPDKALSYLRGRAAKAASDLEPAARSLLPVLLPLLSDPESCPLAAQAILGLDRAAAADVPIEALVSHLVAAVATPGGRNQLLALGLLGETSQQWPAAITATVRERLSGLAEQPRRVVTFGSYDQIIRDDEALRAEIRRFLANSEKFSGAGNNHVRSASSSG